MNHRPNHTLELLALDTLQISAQQLGLELRQATGLALRRTGVLTALAWLAARRYLAQDAQATDQPTPLTLLLWHSALLVAEENAPLLQTLWFDHEGVMPFQFLSTQPALVGLAMRAHLPELVDAQYLPWPDEEGVLIWPRCLQLAALALASGRAQRVICMHLDHAPEGLQAQSLCLRAPRASSPAPTSGALLGIQPAPEAALNAAAGGWNARTTYAAIQAAAEQIRAIPGQVLTPEAESLARLGLSIKSAL